MAAVPIIMVALAVASSIQQGMAASADAKNQAKLHRYNAALSEQNARIAREQAARDEAETRRETQRALARKRAELAQGGVLESKSGVSVLNQAANEGELEALDVRYQGALKSMGLMADSAIQTGRGLMAENDARNANRRAFLGTGSTALNGVSGLMSK